MWLQKLKISTCCCLQARGSGESRVNLQSKSEGLRMKGTGNVQFQAKCRRPMSQLESGQEERTLPYFTFALFRPSVGQMRPIHTGTSNLLYLVYQVKCRPHLETPSQAHQNNEPNIQVFHIPVKLTHTIFPHSEYSILNHIYFVLRRTAYQLLFIPGFGGLQNYKSKNNSILFFFFLEYSFHAFS